MDTAKPTPASKRDFEVVRICGTASWRFALSLCLTIATFWRRVALQAFQGSSPLQRRILSLSVAAGLHLILVYVLILGLRQSSPPRAPAEIMLSLSPGGPRLARSEVQKPQLMLPDEPVIPAPEIESDEAPPTDTITVAAANGGPAVTMPAEAIGTSHTAPELPAGLLTLARQALLRLRLMIATDGSVSDAAIENSSGSTELDGLAVAWVKAHWRYRPAMRDGTAIAVTTTALVSFQ